VLATYKDRAAMEGLIGGLADRRFEVRYRCGRALAHLADLDPALAMTREAAFQAVLREVESGAGVWESRNLLDRMDDESWSPVMDEFVRDRANRSLEHVFTLLALALPRQPLRIAFRGLHTDDPLLRGTALEYLESSLPPEIRRPLWPYLEDNRPKRPGSARPASDALHALLQSSESIVLRLEDLKRMQKPKEEDRSS
jgi:HEAT repeat protein